MKGTIEKHSVKISVGVAVTVILFLIVTSINLATWKTQMEEQHIAMSLRQDQLSQGHQELKLALIALEKEADNRDVQMATINAKLANIESLLIDLKIEIKDSK